MCCVRIISKHSKFNPKSFIKKEKQGCIIMFCFYLYCYGFERMNLYNIHRKCEWFYTLQSQSIALSKTFMILIIICMTCINSCSQAVWDPSGDAGVSLTWQMCGNKMWGLGGSGGESSEMVGRSENILQLSGLSALVKINSRKLWPMGPSCEAVSLITTNAVGGCLISNDFSIYDANPWGWTMSN